MAENIPRTKSRLAARSTGTNVESSVATSGIGIDQMSPVPHAWASTRWKRGHRNLTFTTHAHGAGSLEPAGRGRRRPRASRARTGVSRADSALRAAGVLAHLSHDSRSGARGGSCAGHLY